MAEPSDVEEELAGQLDDLNQQERKRKQDQELDQWMNKYAKSLSADERVSFKKLVAGHAGKAAAGVATKTLKKRFLVWLGGVLVSTAPVWLPIVTVIVMGLFVVIVLVSACNTTAGKVLNIAGKLVTFGQLDICGPLKISTTEQSLSSAGQGGIGSGLASGKLTDAEARAQLRLGNINVNAPRPTTSLEGVNVATMLEVVRFKRECDAWSQGLGPVVRGPCDVVVTGGTEGGHAGGTCSHANGYKVDIRANDTLDRYIQANFTRTVDRDDRSGAVRQYVSNSGSIYAREANHWDILVGCGQTLIET